MHETCLIIIHDPGMRPGPESNRGPWISGRVLYHRANSPPGDRVDKVSFESGSQPKV